MPSKEATSYFSPTITQWTDRPMSRFSMASETATFYSALDSPLSPNKSSHAITSPDCTDLDSHAGENKLWKEMSGRENDSPKLLRQDSGYAAHTSNTVSPLKVPLPKLRSKPKRSTKSQTRCKNWRSTTTRSSLSPPHHSQLNIEDCQIKSHRQRPCNNNKKPKYLLERRYFSELSIFTLSGLDTDKSLSSGESSSPSSPLPFPPTINYWTSDDSRRLEYAAIDAASKGVRGFFVRIVPDFMLPPQIRRTKFWGLESEGRQREGSVRRYRLALPEDLVDKSAKKKDQNYLGSLNKERKGNRPGILRRWSTGLKINRS
ncbi:hypothetical protein HI914_02138 [Erysiphe necator]|uniref:Uncharacterized protein n=1 Tax=Uncinula necator TaxID=52586 RepID=A0A0B1PCS4_UNCNE|nr:hypothetical protein HI914_02138 [Erysiphe necator]KHJ35150.1 hypothetical protein EV44_g2198 [Erysiphe necator]